MYTKFEEKKLTPIEAEKSVTEIFIGEKEKNEQISGTDKQYVAVFVTQYSSLSSFVPNFRTLRQVAAEKSLTEKSLQTNKQAN